MRDGRLVDEHHVDRTARGGFDHITLVDRIAGGEFCAGTVAANGEGLAGQILDLPDRLCGLCNLTELGVLAQRLPAA